MAGRKTKYGPERVTKLTTAIGMGATQRLACLSAGIDPSTLRSWLERYPAFSASIKEAEGRAAVGWLAKIEKAANDGTWQAAAWKLERRYPQEYGRQVREHQGPDGGPVVFTLDIARATGQGGGGDGDAL